MKDGSGGKRIYFVLCTLHALSSTKIGMRTLRIIRLARHNCVLFDDGSEVAHALMNDAVTRRKADTRLPFGTLLSIAETLAEHAGLSHRLEVQNGRTFGPQ